MTTSRPPTTPVLMRLAWLALLLAALLGLLTWLWPQVQQAMRYADLLRQPAPTVRSLPDPLPGVRFADTWGGARSEGRSHEGVDIFAPRGTPVRSTTTGVIGKVGLDRLGGRVVTVTGPGGYHHYYAHLDRYADVTVGEWVTVGTVLGYVGTSGNAAGTPPHLHYGVYTPAWQATNPYPLLRRGT
ncbi:M23 family metallopeptidase [Deinococcus aquiradiocola]|uniref:Peptidase M23 n=1 Tax=Deinococcus aquiradiocola TaxID=393059 RepID=A0A917UPA5_9DEIO|nr:M23 family metallopeptidase [Deinococcus aquiradiocola]GGJ71669.1 peptidase M23 [Deinococcus aquiradiocola]